MTAYPLHLDEMVLEVPTGFADRSLQALEWTLRDGARLTLTIHRLERQKELPLEGMATRMMADMARTSTAFREEQPGTWTDLPFPVVSRRARLRHEGLVVYRHLAFVDLEDRVLVFSVNATPADRERADEILAHALASARLREK